jgi:2-oxo-3-hexenedioate decarboxylase
MSPSTQSSPLITELARITTDAYFEAREIERLTSLETPHGARELTIEQAYEVQAEVLRILESRGDRVIGWKMGLTSQAKMKQMGVHSPIFGALTERMQIRSGDRIALQSGIPPRIHPKIEPEIGFIIGKPLSGEPTLEEAWAACSGVFAAMEIIDSRYRNFEFTLPDVIADNCSGAGFVMGEIHTPRKELDLGNLGMVLDVDGAPVQFGSSSAIFNHPAASLAELVKLLGRSGRGGLTPGMIVLAGASTAAIPLLPGKCVTASVQDLGSVTVYAE